MRDGEGVFAMDNAPRAARDANRCAAQDIVTGSGPEAAITCQEVGRADASICFGVAWWQNGCSCDASQTNWAPLLHKLG